jgi:hypothetical protein
MWKSTELTFDRVKAGRTINFSYKYEGILNIKKHPITNQYLINIGCNLCNSFNWNPKKQTLDIYHKVNFFPVQNLKDGKHSYSYQGSITIQEELKDSTLKTHILKYNITTYK